MVHPFSGNAFRAYSPDLSGSSSSGDESAPFYSSGESIVGSPVSVISPLFVPIRRQVPPSPLCLRQVPPSPLCLRTPIAHITSRAAPPTPCKRRETKKAAIETQFQKVYSSANKYGFIEYRGMSYMVSEAAGARGDFLQLYYINEENSEIVPGIRNSDLVAKVFHEKTLNGAGKPLDNSCEYMKNSLEQYRRLKSLEFPVSIIYNEATATEDGFYLVENIPGAIDIAAWSGFQGKKFNELDSSDQTILREIKAIFTRTLIAREVMDFNLGNLRLNKEGSVVITDFREKKQPAERKRAEALTMTVNEGLTKWSGDNPEIRKYLLEGELQQVLTQLDQEQDL